jgi:hypothetical protein
MHIYLRDDRDSSLSRAVYIEDDQGEPLTESQRVVQVSAPQTILGYTTDGAYPDMRGLLAEVVAHREGALTIVNALAPGAPVAERLFVLHERRDWRVVGIAQPGGLCLALSAGEVLRRLQGQGELSVVVE